MATYDFKHPLDLFHAPAAKPDGPPPPNAAATPTAGNAGGPHPGAAAGTVAPLFAWITDHLPKVQIKDGAATITNQQTAPAPGGGQTTNTQATALGKNGLTYTDTAATTTGSGPAAQTTTHSDQVALGPAGVTAANTNTTQTGDDKNGTNQANTKQVQVGPGGATAAITNTQSQTTDGTTSTSTTAMNAGVDPTKGTATVGASTDNNGTGAGGQLTVDKDGNLTAAGNAKLKTGDTTVAVDATISKDETKLGANVSTPGVKVGLTYDNIHGKLTPDDKAQSGGPISDVMGGADYLSTTRTDQTTVGASLGIKAVDIAGEMTSGARFQVFDKLPPNFDKLLPVDQAAYIQKEQLAQKDRIDKLGGLADLDLTKMDDGSGVRFTSFNGWNASAGVSYGAVGIKGGVGQSSADEVTLAKDGKYLNVNVARQDGVTDQMGLSALGVGVDVKGGHDNTHQFQFQVEASKLDPASPDFDKAAADSMKLFMQTGLLPGADKLQGTDAAVASKKFSDSRGQVDGLNTEIADLQKQLIPAGSQIIDPLTQQQKQDELTRLYAQLNVAQSTLDNNRNYLNDQWQEQHKPGDLVAPGISLAKTQDTQTDTSGLDIGGKNIATNQTSWVHEQYASGTGQTDDRYGYNEKHMFFGSLSDQESVQTDTNQNGIVLSMYSENKVLLQDNADIIKNIKDRNVPDYMLDAKKFDMYGRTTVSLNQQQMNAMATNLNDMNNPQSQAMWADFSSRSAAFMSGDKFTKDVPGADKFLNDQFAEGQQQLRNGWLNDVAGRDPAKDPLAKAVSEFPGQDNNDKFKAISASFGNIKTPADFQKLPAEQQQLYIAVLKQTSGREHDLTDSRSSYEAIAAVSLITDPQVRAQETRSVFVDANEAAKINYRDGVTEFVKFTERFKDDPATNNLVQQGLHYDWKQDDVAQLSKDKKPEDLSKDMNDAFNRHGLLGIGWYPDTDQILKLMQAANKQGGPQEMAKVVKDSGVDLGQLMDQYKGDAANQHMYYDMLVAAGYGDQIKNLPLAFNPS